MLTMPKSSRCKLGTSGRTKDTGASNGASGFAHSARYRLGLWYLLQAGKALARPWPRQSFGGKMRGVVVLSVPDLVSIPDLVSVLDSISVDLVSVPDLVILDLVSVPDSVSASKQEFAGFVWIVFRFQIKII